MHLTLHLTDRCNLACRYCYQRHGTKRMSFETAMTAIAECTADDPNPGIIFFGGEPLLQADLIFRIIDACERAAPQRYHYKATGRRRSTTATAPPNREKVRRRRSSRTSAPSSLDSRPPP